ncbi:MAG: CPBP family intramembrane metalloprotease [Propionibacteriaceae bacterium]|jgi:membrane protease YdiL (CAAX protease family)|nr:CPBP family intramembrane metalloprotease [Propionibacteriaceae bacterium]
MTLTRLIGEPAPTLRDSDGLTDDHPLRLTSSARYSVILRALVFLAAFVAALMLFSSIQFAIQGNFAIYGSSTPLWQLLAAILAYGLLAFLMEGRVWPHEIAPKRLLGLPKGLVVGFVLISVCVGVLAALGMYRVAAVHGNYNPWMDLFVAGVVAAISEEILFRGVLFRLVEEWVGTWGAVGISALVFGFMHLSNDNGSIWGAVAIAIQAGVLLAAVYVVTRSLWWCIGLHFAWNITEGPLWGAAVSGNTMSDSWLVPSWSGPDILTGGTFGLEGSILPVVLCGVVGVGLLVWAARHGYIVAPMWVRKKQAASTDEGSTKTD